MPTQINPSLFHYLYGFNATNSQASYYPGSLKHPPTESPFRPRFCFSLPPPLLPTPTPIFFLIHSRIIASKAFPLRLASLYLGLSNKKDKSR